MDEEAGGFEEAGEFVAEVGFGFGFADLDDAVDGGGDFFGE